jgi:hypothetical protein
MKKASLLSASLALLALTCGNANAALIIQFDFDGEFTMFDPTGSAIAAPSGVSGDMALAIGWDVLGPYDGLASMSGDEPFFNANWTAIGPMTGYQNLIGDYAPDYCAGHDMCADASLDFNWNGNNIPVDASFAMDAASSVTFPDSFSFSALSDFTDSITEAWNNNTLVYFDVDSLDVDGDGVKGTAMTTGPFVGFTPAFTGAATITAICFGTLDTADDCTYAPEPVPVPAAVWLFGSGLIGLSGFASRRRRA